jgi:MoaA/NifB/PqqE/SkfB family radical SAM enzyme
VSQLDLRPLVEAACPHADWKIVSKLWRLGLYRKLANYLMVELLMARGSPRMFGAHPYWLTIDPTNFCQLHCPFCPTGSNKGLRDKSRMQLRHYQKLMDRLGPSLLHMDMMNWGEPVLNPDLPEMIAYAKRFHVEVRFDSNFNHVSDAMLDGLVSSGLDIIGISIDGLTQESYGAYRQDGKLQAVLDNLDALVRKKRAAGSRTPKIIWNFLVFQQNEHEVDRVEEFARAHGVDEVNIKAPYVPESDAFRSAWMPRNPKYRLYPLPEPAPDFVSIERARRVAEVRRTSVSSSYRVRGEQPAAPFRLRYLRALASTVRSRDDLRWALGTLVGAAREAWAADRRKHGADGRSSLRRVKGQDRPICKWPWAGMTVNPEGSVSPCCSIEDQGDDFGNVFEGGWRRLWEGKRYRLARAHVSRFVAREVDVLSGAEHTCQRCGVIGQVNFDFPVTWEQ